MRRAPSARRPWPWLAGAIFGMASLTGAACTPRTNESSPDRVAEPDETSVASGQTCDPGTTPANESPGVPVQLRRAEPWIARLGATADQLVLDPAQIDALNASQNQVPDARVDVRDATVADAARIEASLAERSAWLGSKLKAGAYVEGTPGDYANALTRIDAATPTDAFHVLVKEAPVWCVPMRSGLYTPARDLAFDRNRCSTLRAGAVVRALRTADEGRWVYVHGGHSSGWLHSPTWTPPLDGAEIDAYVDAPRHAFVLEDGVEARANAAGQAVTLRMGTQLPWLGETDAGVTVAIPTPQGLQAAVVPARAVHEGPVPFTRRRLLELAFARLDDPYGWGGHAGGRDCSRYLHDLFAAFGIELGRNSAVQAQQGNRRVELEGLTDADKLRRIEAAAGAGVVLLYMRGHIMLYLGTVDGRPYALSSLSEYLEPCPGEAPGDRVFRLDRVEVTTLELGRDTRRTSFLERLERAVVFAPQDL